MTEVTISKSTGKVIHKDKDGNKTEITGLPPQASLKAVMAKLKVLGLRNR